jgi:hypothetical protein
MKIMVKVAIRNQFLKVRSRKLEVRILEIGRLGNWEIGKLGNWEIGKLGN